MFPGTPTRCRAPDRSSVPLTMPSLLSRGTLLSLRDYTRARDVGHPPAVRTLLRKRTNTVSPNIGRLWKRAGITLGLIGLAGFVWTSSLWYAYQRTLPRHPDPVAGRVYPLNVHGIVVYQTS